MTEDSDITDFIEQFHAERGHSPSQQEIAVQFGVSRTVIRKRMQRLIDRGELVWPKGTRRTVRRADMKGQTWEI